MQSEEGEPRRWESETEHQDGAAKQDRQWTQHTGFGLIDQFYLESEGN
jgi:hypothetical protein